MCRLQISWENYPSVPFFKHAGPMVAGAHIEGPAGHSPGEEEENECPPFQASLLLRQRRFGKRFRYIYTHIGKKKKKKEVPKWAELDLCKTSLSLPADVSQLP